MRDLLLDPVTGDLVVVNGFGGFGPNSGQGDLTFATDSVAIEQDVRQALGLYLGEDALSPDDGTPWFQQVLGKLPSANALREMFKSRIESLPGIFSVDTINLSVDPKTRALTVSFSATDSLGKLIADTVTL